MKVNATGFTLIEMLVATVLAAVLISADLTVFSRLSKDRQLISHQSPLRSSGLSTLLTLDLQQSETIDDSQSNAIAFIGHGSIDRTTFLPDQRWARVTYRIFKSDSRSSLWRTQEYLDDPAAKPLTEWLADDVIGWSLQPGGNGFVRLTIETTSGGFTVERRR